MGNLILGIKELFGKIKTLNAKQKAILIAIVAVVVIGIGVGVWFLSGKPGVNSSNKSTGGKTEYTVTIETAGGMAMSEVDVYIYDGSDLENMQEFAKTNEEGKATFNLGKSSDYAIVLTGVPKGYEVEKYYEFDGESAKIELTSSLIQDEDLSTAQLGLGDVMYDFEVTTSKGEKFKLSEVLKEKKMVVLNFWYTTCSWCLKEFPIMDEVYQDYSEDVAIIALNPMEDATVVKSFAEQYTYSFDYAACPSSWANVFGVTGYPTSVFIDQYGLICGVESGAITSKRPWICAFDHFTAEDYKQMLCVNGVADLLTQIKPTYTMPTSEEIAAAINVGDIQVTYKPETEEESAEWTWPFILADKNGQSCIKASNQGIEDSYAIIYMEVTLKAGQALGFDYLASSEQGMDLMYVIVDDDDIFTISGVSDPEKWQACYPCVAEKDGVYEVALCFMKDESTNEGDDTVYIDNVRVVDQSAINVATYLPRYAATLSEDGETYSYVDVVYNESDGYYHVGSANGPLLLADLMGYTQFNEESSVYQIVEAGDADKDGVSLYDKVEEDGLGMVDYFSYASNSSINGLCTVNKELGEMLKQVSEMAGFEDDPNEWLKICKYFKAYGTSTQLVDPIKGLAPFCAFTTTLGKNVASNYFYYDRAIMPRGLLSKFVPSQSGVYRFTSKSDYQDGIDAWIFDENGEIIYTYEHDERMFLDDNNCSIVYYMEAGKPYYINMAYWDVYATGYINYDVEFIGSSYNLFRLCAPGYFTYDSDATGSAMYDIISGGIKPVLKNGQYYDSIDNSLIYCDFQGATTLFSMSIEQMIGLGGFDFSKSETDGEILAYMKQNDNDIDKTKEYLKELWGEDYDANAELYQIDDVFAGRYHGNGEDYTAEIKTYLSKIDKSGNKERNGCVVVDERLAELLQMLMDKYTFEGVENSWIKLCYYYDYLGPTR